MNTEIEKGLSEFLHSTEVRRTGEIAEIIVDYVEDKPVRLIGFSTQAGKTDFDIQEEGYHYYQKLKSELKNTKISVGTPRNFTSYKFYFFTGDYGQKG